MRQLLIICLLFNGIWLAYSQEAQVDTLHYTGPVENRLNIVILGDGYLEDRAEQFAQHTQNATLDLFDEFPFKNYQGYFNVFSIFLPSNASGAARTPQQLIDNQYGSTFYYAGIERLLVPTKPERVTEVLTEYFPSFDQVIMLVNTGRYGGSGGWIATSSIHEEAGEIILHELGHSFGDLADEYWAGSQYARETYNMTRESSESRVSWKNWLGDFTVGHYPYPANNNWYKPHQNCKMEYLGSRFCSVCAEQLIRTIQRNVLAVDQFSPIEQVVGNDPIRFEVQPVEPRPNTMKIQWELDDELIAENQNVVEIDPTNLDGSFHEVQASIIDTTKYDRRDNIWVNRVTWTIGNGLSSELDRDQIERERDQILSVKASQTDQWGIALFPNPVTDLVTILYDVQITSPMQVVLTDVNGQLIQSFEFLPMNTGPQSFQIDMSSYEKGLYIITIKYEGIVHGFKTIKN